MHYTTVHTKAYNIYTALQYIPRRAVPPVQIVRFGGHCVVDEGVRTELGEGREVAWGSVCVCECVCVCEYVSMCV
jgi:hypothetical protein